MRTLLLYLFADTEQENWRERVGRKWRVCLLCIRLLCSARQLYSAPHGINLWAQARRSAGGCPDIAARVLSFAPEGR
jgi:hypothetical protein